MRVPGFLCKCSRLLFCIYSKHYIFSNTYANVLLVPNHLVSGTTLSERHCKRCNMQLGLGLPQFEKIDARCMFCGQKNACYVA